MFLDKITLLLQGFSLYEAFFLFEAFLPDDVPEDRLAGAFAGTSSWPGWRQ